MPSIAASELRAPALPRSRFGTRFDLSGVAATVLPFALLLYLGLSGGGYDPIVHGQTGIVVWWLVLMGALAGIVPRSPNPVGMVFVGLLAVFCLWLALGLSWTTSSERTVEELARDVAYLGVFALAVVSISRERTRHVLNGVGTAIAVLGALAVLSRLHPAWFPADQTAQFLPGARSRLSYPLNYWNGLAAFMAIGFPVLLAIATSARTLLGRALAAAALPVVALCAFMTLSRGGAIASAVGVLAFLVLIDDRLSRLATTLVAGAGGALLIVATDQRSALVHGLSSATARHEGSEVLAMTLVVCAGVALLQVAIALGVRHGRRPRWLLASRRQAAAVAAVGLAVAIVAFLAAGGPGWLGDRWDGFKYPSLGGSPSLVSSPARFGSDAGNGRYQLWSTAVDAYRTQRLHGIGAGTYEYWWAAHGSINQSVVNAHSLYLETLGEMGIVGFVVLAAFLAGLLGVGTWRAIGAPAATRPVFAAATAGALAFCVTAGVDWIWQIPVLPVTALVLGALIVANPTRGRAVSRLDLPMRGVLALVSLAALAFIWVPLASEGALRRSQQEAGKSNLTAALADARTAEHALPSAASPKLQESLVLEELHRYPAAVARARAATKAEPTNWRNWLVLSRVEAEAGRTRPAVAAYRKAKSLNPRSPIFQ